MIVTILLLLVAVFALMRWLVSRAAKTPQLATYVGAATSAALLAGLLLGSFYRGRTQASTISDVPATAAAPSPAGSAVRPNAVRLTKAQLDALVASPTAALGSLDTLGGFGMRVENRFPVGKPIKASGWVADPAQRPADGMFLIVDGSRRIDGTAEYGQERQDVANAYSTVAMTDTGFEGVEIPTQGLLKGLHVVQLAAIAGDHRTYYVVTTLWRFRLR